MTEGPKDVKKSWLMAAGETVKRAFDMGVFELTIAAGAFGSAMVTHNPALVRPGLIFGVAGLFWAGTYAWQHRDELRAKFNSLNGPR